MNTGSEAADQMTRQALQVSESATKLAAQGAKQLAALLFAVAQGQVKVKGKTNLMRMLKDKQPCKVFALKSEDLTRFRKEAAQYGVLYAVVRDKKGNSPNCDVLARAEDVSKINRIFENMGYAAPTKETATRTAQEAQGKNAPTRAKSAAESRTRGNGLSQQMKKVTEIDGKPPIKPKVAALRKAAKGLQKAAPAIDTQER